MAHWTSPVALKHRSLGSDDGERGIFFYSLLSQFVVLLARF